MVTTEASGIREQIEATLGEIAGSRITLSDTLGPDDVPDWDSLMCVDLVTALQRKLRIKFTPAEIGIIQRRKEPFVRLVDWIVQKQEAAAATHAGTNGGVNGTALAAPTVDFNPDFPVVPIQPAGKKPPFFCLHGAGGIVIPFYELARQMGEDRPFYGIQDTLSDITDRAATVERLAQRYVAAIRQVQPHGPYHLGGLCFGGLVAFEVARQFTAAGETVAQLIMISTPRGDDRFDKYRWHEKLTKGARLAGQIWGDTLRNLNEPAYLALASRRLRRQQAGQRISALENRLCQYLQRHSTFGRIIPPDSKVLLNRQFNVQKHGMMKLAKHHMKLHRAYVGDRYAGPVTFIKAEHAIVSTEGYADDVQGWRPLFAGPVAVKTIPGCHHMNITRDPFVADLARVINEALSVNRE